MDQLEKTKKSKKWRRLSTFLIVTILTIIILLLIFAVLFTGEKTTTIYPTDDIGLGRSSSDIPSNNSEYAAVRNDYGAGGGIYEWDALIKFEISLPSDAEIKSATLKLYYCYWWDNNPAGRNLNLYRVTSDWNETNSTWKNQPSYAPLPSCNSTVPTSYGWMNWDVTNDVKSFVSGQATNYGWKITDETYWGTVNIPVTRFQTKEYGENIPSLEITTKNMKLLESPWFIALIILLIISMLVLLWKRTRN